MYLNLVSYWQQTVKSYLNLVLVGVLVLNLANVSKAHNSSDNGRKNKNKQSKLFEQSIDNWPAFKQGMEAEKEKIIESIQGEKLVKELTSFFSGTKSNSESTLKSTANEVAEKEAKKEAEKGRQSAAKQVAKLAELEPLELEALGREAAQKEEQSNLATIIEHPEHMQAAKSIATSQANLLTNLSKELDEEGKLAELTTEIPCLDGNCVDKSYASNNQMVKSLAKLKVAKEAKPKRGQNSSLFPGQRMSCQNSGFGYNDCCSIDRGGWGRNFLNARCNSEEQGLAKMRGKDLCIYIGTKQYYFLLAKTYEKQVYCCFGHQLDKLVQEQGRSQLRMGFGSTDYPNCRGLSLKEIELINWDKIDFSAVITELRAKFTGNKSLPSAKDFERRIRDSLPDIRGEEDELDPLAGVNGKLAK